MPIGIDPKVDFAFKYVFGREQNEPLLVLLLNAILDPPPAQRLVGLTLLNPLLPQDATEDKLSILDIRAHDTQGRIYNIEMQMLSHKFLKERVLYYWAKLFSQQLTGGDDYKELQPTISVLLLDDLLFPGETDCHQRFRLWNETHSLTYSDRLEIHVIELPKFVKVQHELRTDLDGWLFFLQHIAQLELNPWPSELRFAGLQHAAKELEMLAATDLERQRYEDRVKGQMDLRSGLLSARLDGIVEGRVEGRVEAAIQVYQELLNLPLTSFEEIERMSREEQERLLLKLKSAMRAR